MASMDACKLSLSIIKYELSIVKPTEDIFTVLLLSILTSLQHNPHK